MAYNVRLALNRYDLTDEEKDARVEYVLDLLGMAKYKKKPVSKLSGGQQQRVSIARALIKSPDIILADEPTGNLDEENTLRTMSSLKSISKSCLVLLVTHERRVADIFADRIIEIRDGAVVRDVLSGSGGSYDRSDDANIYLKELECTNIETELAQFRIFCQKEETTPPIRLNLAWRDGKLYLQNNTGVDLIIEGEASGVQLVDTVRPHFDEAEMDKISYDLTRPSSHSKASLTPREILRMATENISLMGKRGGFVLGILLITGVLLSLVMAQYANAKLVNKFDFVTTDDHYLSVDFEKISSLRSNEEQAMILEFEEKYLIDGELGILTYVPSTGLYLLGTGFYQMTNVRQVLSGYSFAQLDVLDESTLLYGSLPTTRNEIVIDRSIAEKWLSSGGILTSYFSTIEDFIGVELYANTGAQYITIVGICDSDEPDIYCSKSLLLSLGRGSFKVMTVPELNTLLDTSYETLGDYEILIREGLLTSLSLSIGDTLNLYNDEDVTYTIVGTFPDNLDTNYIISDFGLKRLTEYAIYSVTKSCMLYLTEEQDPEEIVTLLSSYGKSYRSYFNITTDLPYETELANYLEARNIDVDAKSLIALLVSVISLVMIYFTIKSNVISRCEELTVYRLIGISRKSIILAFLLEMALITTMTSLPAVCITTGVLKYIATIPSLSMDFHLPLWCIFALLGAIYLAHLSISILPVWNVLRQPPAALAVKE